MSVVRQTLERLTRRRYPNTARLHDYRRRPEFLRVREEIRRAGADHLPTFENEYTHEGGLALQQNPDEFAALCLFLNEHLPLRTYLEIGSASGGACLFLHRQLGFEQVISLDDGRHDRAAEQEENFKQIPGLERFVGDSHSPAAGTFVSGVLDRPLDVAFVDGDHTYDGVRQDIELVLRFSRPGTLVILHDVLACPGVTRSLREAVAARRLDPLAEFIGRSRPLGIAVAAVLDGEGLRRPSA